MMDARDFWDQKILRWEVMRYSQWTLLHPLSWTVRARLKRAAYTIFARMPSDARILELGCGSGLLADKIKDIYLDYTGLDIAPAAIRRAKDKKYPAGYAFKVADVTTAALPDADCCVFLGLTDWLEEPDLRDLLIRVTATHLLFSYTDAAALSPYRAYRAYLDEPQISRARKARNYPRAHIEDMLAAAGYCGEHIYHAGALDPGAMIWASKSK